jgi:hypothetical protein
MRRTGRDDTPVEVTSLAVLGVALVGLGGILRHRG